MRAIVLISLLAPLLFAAPVHAQNGAAVLAGDHIELRTPITFDTGTANVDAESQQVLDEVVGILRMHPDIAVDIGVHSDSSGSSAFNQAQT